MSDLASRPDPLTHGGSDKSDERLASEASAHLARFPALQVVAELLTRLREMQLPWWTPEHLRKAYGASDRMLWLAERPDVRQRITTELTGLAPKAARRKAPEFQASLIDSVIDDGDISSGEFEASFDPLDLAVYGPAAELWRLFRRRMPWEDDATLHQDLIGWLIGALLADKSTLDGSPRTPILTPWHVRTSIDGRVWHSRIPVDVRVEIDEARLRRERERPNEPFHAFHDLVHAPPALIAASIPLKDLVPVLDVAGRAMGFEGEGEHGSGAGRSGREGGSSSIAPSSFGAASARPSAMPPAGGANANASAWSHGTADAGHTPAAEDETAEPPPADEGAAEVEDLPSVGDDEDPLARTNPWELPDGVPPPEEGAPQPSNKRSGRRKR